ncbi:MAG: DNA helicase RecQ [Bacteroidales bacterium]|nr:DNA helicase RecQ [Bacteroidales bacterium]
MNIADIDLYKELKNIFGFDNFKGYQKQVVTDILSGQDVLVIMPTGGGKSLCYQLPAVVSQGVAVIISPLIALMKNQVDAIRHIKGAENIAHFINSSLSKHEITKVRKDITEGSAKLLYVAPESLIKQENIDFLKSVNISFVAIDEAHCISEWGHDFRPEYRKIREIITNIGQDVPVMALTATATEKVRQDIIKNLEIPDANVYVSSFNRPNLYYEVRPKPDDEKILIREIISFINANRNKSGIIYCLSRKKVEQVAEILTLNGIKAVPYHAGLDSNVRAMHQDMFLLEQVDVIVATIAFGMGIDKPDVRFIIHYDMPKSLEGYYQETGRAGRDGQEGKCIAFYSEKDIAKLERFLVDKTVAEREVAMQLTEAVTSYAESALCRRITLLKYFSEDYNQCNCGNCDNCLHPKKRVEAHEDILLALDAVEQTMQIFKTDHLINILIGNKTADVKTCRHNKLPVFGAGADKSKAYWRAVFRQCIIEGFVKKEIETYGLLKLLPKAESFRNHPYDILIPQDHDYTAYEESDSMQALQQDASQSASDEVLFAILKNIRNSIAEKENLPPYIIFEERSLIDMTIQYPTSLESMKNISGVGEAKAKKYGEVFCQAIKKYVEENDIEIPQELIIKSAINNRSGLKVYIIKSIDKKIPLEDIAKGKNLDMDELLKEIESIVSSGTKIDISYYVNETVDVYHQQEITECLKEMQSDNVYEVLEELGEDEYTEQEVRLMRIVFISKYGQ